MHDREQGSAEVDGLAHGHRQTPQRAAADRRTLFGDRHGERVVGAARGPGRLGIQSRSGLHRRRVSVDRGGGDATRRDEQVAGGRHPVLEQWRSVLPCLEDGKWRSGRIEAPESRRRLVHGKGCNAIAQRANDRLTGVAALHEEGCGSGAGVQLRGHQQQVGAAVREGRHPPARRNRRSCSRQRSQRTPDGVSRSCAGREVSSGRGQFGRRGEVAGHGQRRSSSRMVEGSRQDAAELRQGVINGDGGGGQPLHARGRDRWVGLRRIGGAEPQANAHDQRDRDGRDRSAQAGATYHRRVDLDRLHALPKAELHQHLDGSLRPETAVELAAQAGTAISLEEAVARLVAPPRCRDQAELLRFFDLPIALLQTAASLQRVTTELVESMAADGLTYAEIRWAPRLHLERGLSVNDVIDAVATGIGGAASRLGPRTPFIGLIVTAMRSHPPGANVELARAAAAFGPPVIGFDLAGPEAAYPAPPHAAAFVAAAAGGLALTAHAGEVPGAERIREALALGVRRIAHGVTAADDPDVVALVRERDVTLDLCPTSNVQAGIVADLAAHPLAALHRAGVSVTLSTDDRTVSATTLTEEMARTADALHLTRVELAAIAVNGFRRAFGPPDVLEPMTSAAEAAWSAWAAEAPGLT